MTGREIYLALQECGRDSDDHSCKVRRSDQEALNRLGYLQDLCYGIEITDCGYAFLTGYDASAKESAAAVEAVRRLVATTNAERGAGEEAE